MPLEVQQHTDAPPAPGREERKAKALAAIEARAAAEPKTEEPKLVTAPAAAPVVPKAAEPIAAPAKPAAEQKLDQPAAAPGETAEALKAAIAQERADRAVKDAQRDAQQAKSEAQLLRAQLDAGKKDWRRALADAGHRIEDVVQEWVGGTEPGATPPAAAAQPRPAADNSELAALRAELAELKGQLNEGAQQYTRGQRLQAIKQMLTGAEDYELGAAFSSEDFYLSQIEAREKDRGSQLGEIELRETLRELEGGMRGRVDQDLKRLLTTKWGRSLLKTLLEAAAPGEKTGDPNQAQPLGEKTGTEPDLLNANSAPVSRVVNDRLSYPELRKRAMAKALEAAERRRAGI